MSSASRNPSQMPTNKLYINIGAVQSSIVDTNLAVVPWVTQVGALSTAGRCLFRDMGKTVYVPDPTVGNATAAGQSSILRKVQLIPSGTQGSYGTGGVAGTVGTEFFTGYVRLGGQTYAGGTGVPTMIARIN